MKDIKRSLITTIITLVLCTNAIYAEDGTIINTVDASEKSEDCSLVDVSGGNLDHNDDEITVEDEENFDFTNDLAVEEPQEDTFETEPDSTGLISSENNETEEYGIEPDSINNNIFSYQDDGDEITITGLLDPNKVINNPVIPSSINGMPVTEIASKAFEGSKSLKGKLTIPGSVKTIEQHAFRNCIGITGLKIYDGVEEIEGGFYYDYDHNENLSGGAFAGCTGIKGDLVIPDTVKEIGKGAFRNCISLTSVTIPYDVDVIEEATFYGCTGLKKVVIEGAETIEYQAFEGCTSLTGDIVFPNTIKDIGYASFEYCNAITGLTIPSSVKNCFGAFIGCYGVKKIINKSSCKLRISELLRDDKEYFINAKTGEEYRRSIDETYVRKGTYIKKEFSKPEIVKGLSLSYRDKGIRVSWKRSHGVTGYYVYRSDNGKKYKKVATVTTVPDYPFAKKIIYEDKKSVSKGVKYSYKVCAFNAIGKKITKGAMSSAKDIFYLEAPEITSIKKTNTKSIILKWKGSPKYGGYEIQCSRSIKFKDHKTVTIKSGKTSAKKITGLWGGRKCYVRIRSFKKSDKVKSFGPWSKTVSIDL